MIQHPVAALGGVRWILGLSYSTATVAAVVLTTWTGPARLVGGPALLGALAGAMWIAQDTRFVALAPSIGLALAAVILIGLALAALGVLRAAPVALAVAAATLAIVWTACARPTRPHTRRAAPTASPTWPNLFALGGAGIFVAAAFFAIRYSAVSATTDAQRASSLAVWAYPAGGRLEVGARDPVGHGPVRLRIAVTTGGAATRAWDIRLRAGRSWQAPPLALTGVGPEQVVARDNGRVVASLSIAAGGGRVRAPAVARHRPRRARAARP